MYNPAMTKDERISDGRLFEMAEQALGRAWAPYSKFHVAAALVTDTGEVFTGVNVENASYGLTVCAERVAVFKAVSEGARKIRRIAVVSSSGDYAYPCGACRQVLNEFSDGTEVMVKNAAGQVEKHPLDRLLPHAFGKDTLTS